MNVTKNTLSLATLAVVAGLVAPAADAATVFVDATKLRDNSGNTLPAPNAQGLGDAIGKFDTTSLTVSDVGPNQMSFSYTTQFPSQTPEKNHYAFADVFFDLNLDGTFDYAFVTGKPNDPTKPAYHGSVGFNSGVTVLPTFAKTGIYEVGNTVYNAGDFDWSPDPWGAQYKAGSWQSPVPVKLGNTGQLLLQAVTPTVGGAGANFNTFTFTLDLAALGWTTPFNVFWATGNCGNDPILTTVPLPGALSMMMPALASLAAFGAVRRRSATPSAA